MAAFQAIGNQSAGQASVAVAWPAHIAGDLGLIVIETSGDATTINPPSGWQAVTGNGVADLLTTAGSRLWVWWKFATSSAEANVNTGDSGDHQVARIVTFRNVNSVNPIRVTTSDSKTVASTTVTWPSLSGVVNQDLIVLIASRPDDSTSVAAFSNPVNANLTGLTERGEAGTNAGNGGGFVVVTGTQSFDGGTGATTMTGPNTTNAELVIALTPRQTPQFESTASGQATASANLSIGQRFEAEPYRTSATLTNDQFVSAPYRAAVKGTRLISADSSGLYTVDIDGNSQKRVTFVGNFWGALHAATAQNFIYVERTTENAPLRYSADGVTWSNSNLQLSNAVLLVADPEGSLVLVFETGTGAQQNYWYSTDHGATYTPAPCPAVYSGTNIYAIAGFNAIFVTFGAANDSNTDYFTVDGTTWLARSSSLAPYRQNFTAYNGRVLASLIGTASVRVLTSYPDIEASSYVADYTVQGLQGTLLAFTAIPETGIFYAWAEVFENGKFNAYLYKSVVDEAYRFEKVCKLYTVNEHSLQEGSRLVGFGDKLFIAGGPLGGTNYPAEIHAIVENAAGASSASGQLRVAARFSSSDSNNFTSFELNYNVTASNDITKTAAGTYISNAWFRGQNPSSLEKITTRQFPAANRVLASGNGVVLAGGGGIYRSTDDGITWTRTLAADISNTVRSLKYESSLGKFLLNRRNVVSLTTDGVVFEDSPALQDLISVSYGNGIYVAFTEGTGFVYVSSSLAGPWTAHSIGSSIGSTYNSEFAGGYFWAAAQNGSVYKSTNGINWSVETALPGGAWFISAVDGDNAVATEITNSTSQFLNAFYINGAWTTYVFPGAGPNKGDGGRGHYDAQTRTFVYTASTAGLGDIDRLPLRIFRFRERISTTTTASLSVGQRFSASSAALATTTANVTAQILFAASAEASSAADASLATPPRFDAAAEAAAQAQADINTAIRLNAEIAATVTTTADLFAQVRLFTSALGEASASADITTQTLFAASVTADAAATGDLTALVQLAADAAADATASANLTIAARLSADVAAEASASADLTVGSTFLTSTQAASEATAELTTQIQAASSAQADANASASLTTEITLDAAAQADASAAADLTALILLDAEAAGQAQAAADLATEVLFVATAGADATASADLTTQITVDATATADATTSADLTTQITASAAAQADATASADLTTAITLEAAVDAETNLVTAILFTNIPLHASVQGEAAADAELTTAITLEAAATAQAQASLLPSQDRIEVSWVAAGINTAVGRALRASVSAAAAATADLDARITAHATAQAQAQSAADLTAAILLEGASQAEVDADADLSTEILASAQVQIEATANADLDAKITAEASVTGQVSVIAELATAIQIDAAAAVEVSVSAELSAFITAQSSAQAQAQASAELATQIFLAASETAETNTVLAALNTGIVLAASASGNTTGTANITVSPRLYASAQADAQASADLTTAITVESAAQAQTSVSASLTALVLLSADLACATTATGDLAAQIQIVASAVADASASASLNSQIRLAASASAVTSVAGELTTQIRFAADAQAQTTGNADLTALISFESSAQAAAIASAELTALILFAASETAETNTVLAMLNTGIVLSGAATSASAASSDLSVARRFSAQVVSGALSTGSLATQIQLSGSAPVAASAAASLTTRLFIFASAGSIAASLGSLTTQIRLDAQAQVSALASPPLTTIIRLAGSPQAAASAVGLLSILLEDLGPSPDASFVPTDLDRTVFVARADEVVVVDVDDHRIAVPMQDSVLRVLAEDLTA